MLQVDVLHGFNNTAHLYMHEKSLNMPDQMPAFPTESRGAVNCDAV